VCVDLGPRVITIFEDILAGWEVHQQDAIDHQTSNNKSTLQPAQPIQEPAATQAKLIQGSNGAAAEIDVEVIARQVRIEAAKAEGARAEAC